MRKRWGVAAIASLLTVAALAQLPQRPYEPAFRGDPAKSQPEAVALGYMRTVVAAQRLYFKKHGQYAASLTSLVGSGSFTRRMAKTDRGEYQVSFRGGKERYGLQLTPREFAPDRRAFYVDQTGTFHVEDDKPASAASPKLTAGD